MKIERSHFGLAACWLSYGAAVSSLFSIAVCQILMGAALLALLLSTEPKRFPPVKLPLALFFAGTIISMLFSENPAAGLPQLRKFYVFAVMLIIYSTFRDIRKVKTLMLAWITVASASAAVALFQFHGKWQEARELATPFYLHYVGDRITGFMSHWMTFGGQMMMTVLMLAAFLFFTRCPRRCWLAGAACGATLGLAIILGFTRSIWMATAAGGLYLIWCWRRKLILLVPIVLALGLWLGPDSVRERLLSVFQPHGEVDSNQHRIVTWRTGWEMIQAHPWLGLGPENVGRYFDDYVPEDVPRPLPDGWYGHLHNIYLQYAAERGIPVMLCLMWFLFKALWDFQIALRRRPPPEVQFVLHGASASILAILVSGVFELNLGDTEVLTMFLAVVTCGYIGIRDAKLQRS